MVHAFRRALGLHPRRRAGEPNARSAAELVEFIRRDHYQRRHDDSLTYTDRGVNLSTTEGTCNAHTQPE